MAKSFFKMLDLGMSLAEQSLQFCDPITMKKFFIF